MGFEWTVLVGRERMSKMVMATALPQDGETGRFAVDRCEGFLEENGYKCIEIIVKSDQEETIKNLVDHVVASGENGRIVVEEFQRGVWVATGWLRGLSRRSKVGSGGSFWLSSSAWGWWLTLRKGLSRSYLSMRRT